MIPILVTSEPRTQTAGGRTEKDFSSFLPPLGYTEMVGVREKAQQCRGSTRKPWKRQREKGKRKVHRTAQQPSAGLWGGRWLRHVLAELTVLWHKDFMGPADHR